VASKKSSEILQIWCIAGGNQIAVTPEEATSQLYMSKTFQSSKYPNSRHGVLSGFP